MSLILVTDTNALGQTGTTAYDVAGNEVSDTDRDGPVRTFSYDALNRKTAEHWLDASGNVTRTTAWSLDAAGRATWYGPGLHHGLHVR